MVIVAKKRKARVEEHDHAYLVRGVAEVQDARLALFEHLGRKKWTRIARMPARPIWTGEFEPRKDAEPAVALYFNIAERCPDEARCGYCRRTPKDVYKP